MGGKTGTSGSVTVNASTTLDHFDFAVASPQVSGTAFTGVNTLTAKDAGGNTIAGFDASANNVTITSNPADGTITGLGSGGTNVLDQAGDFTAGVANLTYTVSGLPAGTNVRINLIGTYQELTSGVTPEPGMASRYVRRSQRIASARSSA